MTQRGAFSRRHSWAMYFSFAVYNLPISCTFSLSGLYTTRLFSHCDKMRENLTYLFFLQFLSFLCISISFIDLVKAVSPLRLFSFIPLFSFLCVHVCFYEKFMYVHMYCIYRSVEARGKPQVSFLTVCV